MIPMSSIRSNKKSSYIFHPPEEHSKNTTMQAMNSPINRLPKYPSALMLSQKTHCLPPFVPLSLIPPNLPPSPRTLLKLQTIPHTLPHPLLKLRRIIPPQARRLHIRRRLIVRAGQHGDNAKKNRFGCLHGRPAFRGGFVAVLVFFGWVQDRDAYFAVLVD